MNEGLVAAAALTLAGSVHCVGMCGPFVLGVAAGPTGARTRALQQILLQLGKATSYAFLGALAGAAGATVIGSTVRHAGQALAVVAAVAMVLAGLGLLGLRARGAAAPWAAPLYARAIGPLVRERPAGFSLVVGMLMGLLPCGLVYAGLAAAAASGSPAQGALILAGVALGTVPALTVTAFGGALVPVAWRSGFARAAGVLLIAAAAFTLVRTLGGGPGHGAHGRTLPASAPADGTATPAPHANHH